MHIGGFLEKFLHLEDKRNETKSIFIESVEKNSNIKIKDSQINISGGVVVVSGSPALKNELFINKEKILNYFNSKSKEKIENIR